jgi:hypothetical protein
MATRTEVSLIDDLEDAEVPADGTFRFGLDGLEYEIDLSNANANKLTQALAPFIEKARRVGTARSAARRPQRSVTSREKSSDIRAWAREHGHKISERGRIPATIVAEYEQSTNGRGRAPAHA